MRKEKAKQDTPLRYRRFFLIAGIAMLLSEVWKQITLTFFVNGGDYLWLYFPFQLCSTPMYVLLLLPHVRHRALRDALLTYLMTFGLLGGGIVFADTSGLHYPLAALTFHSFAWHILLIAVGILAGAALEEGPGARSFGGAAGLYLLFCGAASVLNAVLGQFGEIDLFYINPAVPMEQVVFRDLVPALGNGAVILLYIAMTAVGAGLLALFWRAVHAKKRHG